MDQYESPAIFRLLPFFLSLILFIVIETFKLSGQRKSNKLVKVVTVFWIFMLFRLLLAFSIQPLLSIIFFFYIFILKQLISLLFSNQIRFFACFDHVACVMNLHEWPISSNRTITWGNTCSTVERYSDNLIQIILPVLRNQTNQNSVAILKASQQAFFNLC